MGWFSNKIRIKDLNPGDHIYTWRRGYSYSHHGGLLLFQGCFVFSGIHMGKGKVIHLTRGESRNGFSSSPSPSHPSEGPVLCTTLKKFLSGGDLYRYEYGVNSIVFLFKRSGTCTRKFSDPTEDVLDRALLRLTRGFGDYDLLHNNCEDWVRTGLSENMREPTSFTALLKPYCLFYYNIRFDSGEGSGVPCIFLGLDFDQSFLLQLWNMGYDFPFFKYLLTPGGIILMESGIKCILILLALTVCHGTSRFKISAHLFKTIFSLMVFYWTPESTVLEVVRTYLLHEHEAIAIYLGFYIGIHNLVFDSRDYNSSMPWINFALCLAFGSRLDELECSSLYHMVEISYITHHAESVTKWEPPDHGWLKINSDATIRLSRCSIIMVVRNELGDLVFLASKVLGSVWLSSFDVEVEALACASTYANSCGWTNISFEMDAKEVVEAVRLAKDPGSRFSFDNLMAIRRRFSNPSLKLSWKPRKANLVADTTTKCFLSNNISFFIDEFSVDELPFSISNCLSVDKHGQWFFQAWPIPQRRTDISIAGTADLVLERFWRLALCTAGLDGVYGAGECGKSSPDREAFKLVPCASAAQDVNAPVSDRCCSAVKKIGHNPTCLCAVMLSNTAKSSGVKPEIAVTIPKRCNISDRPVGYKCGAYTLP
ncbi:hypothetical protein FNV43_RR24690 [Rhamnella rubrinervis]|uniref:LRAT domain-containing protein n=1 Tax=Rhamnella rubrinervis TaxID=2594499 RepID=A0A8K0GQY2_9ROSA|nr:hypothetical protein FNV43_RR24690 [Rhamnella rubrinervis]